MSGLFITMEGTDGAGKTTQIKLLKDFLVQKGFEVVSLREPGGNTISEKIREIIIDKENDKMSDMTEAMLYAASRAQLVKEVIIPNLNEGNIVLCDRFVDSSIVYQGYARGMGEDIIENINQYATQGIAPDMTFFLKLSPEASLERKKKQEELDRIEAAGNSFHKRVYNGYLKLVEKNKKRIRVIDAENSIKDIHEEIIQHIERLLKERSF